MDKKRVALNILAPLVGLGVFIGIWFLAASTIGFSLSLPSPAETFPKLFLLFSESSFYLAVGKTLARTLLAFLLAFLLSCLFAFLAKVSVFFRKAFSPLTVIVRVMPTISIILLVLRFVYGRFAPIVITFIVIFPMLYTTVFNAAEQVDGNLLEMSRSYALSMKKRIFNLYLPSMIPAILTGVSLTLSFSVKLTIAAEVLSATQESMGLYMQMAYSIIQTDVLLAWTLAAILLGFVLEGLVLLIRKLIVRHYHGM